MKMYLIITILAIAITVIFCSMAFVLPLNDDDKKPKQPTYTEKQLYIYTFDKDPLITERKAIEEYKMCPALRPERFRRRIKMLWGVDINDYPENAQIWFDENILVSKKFQTIENRVNPGDEYPFPFPKYPDSIFIPFRQYLFLNDQSVFNTLLEYKNKTLIELSKEADNADPIELLPSCDFLQMVYTGTPFNINPHLVSYIDSQAVYGDELFISRFGYYKIPGRAPDIRCDYLSMYITQEKKKGRNISNDPYNENNEIWLGFYLIDRPMSDANYNLKSVLGGIASFNYMHNIYKHRPWHNYIADRNIAAFLSFLLQLDDRIADKQVLLFISGQMDYYMPYNKEIYEEIRENIKNNNYYGYTILREFCENHQRKMPTLEKIGSCYQATVKSSNTLLYLEPFAESYDIDAVHPTEKFKVYEMGHDDYYFVEIEKPVESPIAGDDGYAKILDQKETVFGYINKEYIDILNIL